MQNYLWIIYAALAAVCAAGVNVLAKFGMERFDKDLATALRSIVQAGCVVGFCLAIGVFRKADALAGGAKGYVSVALAGLLGGLSWIFVFRALAIAPVSKVAPIDKLSLPLSILLAVAFLKERPSAVNWAGIGLVVAGVYLATHKPA